MRTHLRQLFKGLSKEALPSRIAIYLHEVREDWLPTLEELCDYFLMNGYCFVLPEDYLRSDGEKKILLTFDDAYANWLNASKLLSRKGVSAIFYLTTGVFRDKASSQELLDFYGQVSRSSLESTLSSHEAKEIFNMGHSLGVHGHRHLNLSETCISDMRIEIEESFNVVSEITSSQVKDFAFTYGMPRYFPLSALKICRELGLERIAYGCGGLLQRTSRSERIDRTLWKLWEPLEYNLNSLRIDARVLSFTGRDFTSDGKKMPSLGPRLKG